MFIVKSLVALALGASMVQAVPIGIIRPGSQLTVKRGHHKGMPQGVMVAQQHGAECQVKHEPAAEAQKAKEGADKNKKEKEAADAKAAKDAYNAKGDAANVKGEDKAAKDANSTEAAQNADGAQNVKDNANNTEAGAGAALYWMTNEPDGNFVMSAVIDAEGQLTFGDAIWAGGVGAHGATEKADDPDPLFSQGAVKVVGEALVAVNPGSNTLTMFNIDPQNPGQLTMAGGPVSSGGEFPVSATISKANGNVCVLNSGAVNGVQCYTADPGLGLQVIPNSLRSLELKTVTPPVGPADTPSQILFSEDGTQLFAAVKGNPDAPGFIAAWEVAEDGSLSEKFVSNAPAGGGALPFGMTFINGGPALLSTDPALGFTVYNFDGVNAQADTGVAIDGQVAACWVDFSKVTGNFYITDIGTSLLTEVSVDPKTLEAKVVNQYPQGEDHSTIDNAIANVGGKDFVYLMSPGSKTIEVMELVAPGEANAVQTFDIAAAAADAGITVNSANLQGANVFFQA